MKKVKQSLASVEAGNQIPEFNVEPALPPDTQRSAPVWLFLNDRATMDARSCKDREDIYNYIVEEDNPLATLALNDLISERSAFKLDLSGV